MSALGSVDSFLLMCQVIGRRGSKSSSISRFTFRRSFWRWVFLNQLPVVAV